jgi:hypothetical protein
MASVVITRRSGKVDDAEFARFVNDPNGPIRRDLRRRATLMQQYQIRRAPRRTGRLVSTSRKRETSRGPLRPAVEVIIGKDGLTDYLGYILFGTHAHVIRAIPNRPNAHLRFVVGGRIVFAKEVLHPGTRANNFVRDSLRMARG